MAPAVVLNHYSRQITVPKSQGNSQAMLYATGIKDEAQMQLPQVGIASVWWEGNPCTNPTGLELTEGNMHLLDLAKEVKKGVEETGQANPFIFNTIGISDAIGMGTEGMRSSLPSRDLIADSIECVVRGSLYDANVSLVYPFCKLAHLSPDATKTWYAIRKPV
jgi:dihydroxy-acid dehydratase